MGILVIVCALLCVIICLAPITLIVIGFSRLHSENGFQFFLSGTVFAMFGLAFLISDPIGDLICNILSLLGISASFHDTYLLDLAIVVLGTYLSSKFYWWISNRKARLYVAYAEKFIPTMEDPTLSSCSHIIIGTLTDVINKTPRTKFPTNVQRTVEIETYKIASHFLGSSNYRDVFGELNDQGCQFLSISLNCLDHFLHREYITSEEYNSMMVSLREQSEGFYKSF